LGNPVIQHIEYDLIPAADISNYRKILPLKRVRLSNQHSAASIQPLKLAEIAKTCMAEC
jgi:hypothetical protein